MEACSLLVNLRERDVELKIAAVSGEDRCVTTLITAAKETRQIGKCKLYHSFFDRWSRRTRTLGTRLRHMSSGGQS